jgi:hypothetical protein
MGWQEGSPFGSAALFSVPNFSLLNMTAGGVLQPSNLIPADKVQLTSVGLTGTAIGFYTSYEVSINAAAGSVGSQGFVQIMLTWYNLATDTFPIDEVIWYIPANLAGALTVGHGPNRGNFLAVQAAAVEVAGTTPTVLTQVSITGSQRPGADHNWYAAALPQEAATTSSARAYTSELVSVSAFPVAGPGTALRYCFMQAGRAHLHVENRTGAGTLTADLSDAPFGLTTVFHSAIPENSFVDADLILPRMGMILTLTNTGAAAATVYATLVGDRV